MSRSAVVFNCLLPTVLLLTVSLVEAQQPKKVPRIGYLAADSHAPTRDSFLQGLRVLGYVEDKPDRFPELAAELVRLKLDVIVAANATALGALRRATTTIPIVMAAAG